MINLSESTYTNNQDEEWDDSGKVEKIIFQEALRSYEKVWTLFDSIEEKANRMLTRDIAFISLIFTGVTLIAAQNLNQVYWTVLSIIMAPVVVLLSLSILYNLEVHKVRKFKMIVPSGLIKTTEEAPNVKKVYMWLIHELEEAAKTYENVCSKKGDKLEKALVFESLSAIGVIISIFLTIIGYFFLK